MSPRNLSILDFLIAERTFASVSKRSLSAKLVLRDAILFATCLVTLEKEINRKLQETRYTLQSRAATCNGFEKALQKVERSSTAGITWCNFRCNLSCNGVARQATGRLQRVTCPLKP